MRLLFKIILFPVTLSLTIVSFFFRFLTELSGALLSVVAVIVFAIALGTLVFLGDPKGALGVAVMAFVISPYGIPKLAEWLLDRLDDLNGAIRSI